MNYLHLLNLTAPEVIIVATGFAVLAADRLAMSDLSKPFRFLIGALISSAGCVAAIVWMLALPTSDTSPGPLIVEPITQFVKTGLLILTLLTVWMSLTATFTDHVGEYLGLILLATAGMMFLVSSADILMIFISLELTSLCLYILTAFNKRNLKSAEAAFKYFLFGSMAAAFTLFGLSLLYGVSGSTNLIEIAAKISAIPGASGDPLIMMAIVMTLAGFAFKIAAAPFHLWAPDAYEGAPIPSAALISAGSKVAGFFVLARVTMVGLRGLEGNVAPGQHLPGWLPFLVALAVLSMILGNFAALAQNKVRRLLAYSAIAHAGYLLLGVMAHSNSGIASVIYYSFTYGLATLGAFWVIGLVPTGDGDHRLSDFAGLSAREPVAAFALMVFVLSLAGIPPLAGFFGKFFVFVAVLKGDPANRTLFWPVLLAILLSAVSLYYYLQILKQAFVEPAHAFVPALPVKLLDKTFALLIAAAVIILGCFPNIILDFLGQVLKLNGAGN
jgi:NADH-quinone oxidoreductase subunit N